jgi:hypothetical protein
MREIDGLSIIFIDLYVPALTPWLHRSGVSLQLSEIVRFFAICCNCHQEMGLNEPLGFPANHLHTNCRGYGAGCNFPQYHLYMNCRGYGTGKNLVVSCSYFLGHRHLTFKWNSELYNWNKWANKQNYASQIVVWGIYVERWFQVVSKTSLISKNTAAIDRYNVIEICHMVSKHLHVMLWHVQKQNWLAHSRYFCTMFSSAFTVAFSNNLTTMDGRLIRLPGWMDGRLDRCLTAARPAYSQPSCSTSQQASKQASKSATWPAHTPSLWVLPFWRDDTLLHKINKLLNWVVTCDTEISLWIHFFIWSSFK